MSKNKYILSSFNIAYDFGNCSLSQKIINTPAFLAFIPYQQQLNALNREAKSTKPDRMRSQLEKPTVSSAIFYSNVAARPLRAYVRQEESNASSCSFLYAFRLIKACT